MSLTLSKPLPDTAIHEINSLGGPPLPMGASLSVLNIIMENINASQTSLLKCKIATSLVLRQVKMSNLNH